MNQLFRQVCAVGICVLTLGSSALAQEGGVRWQSDLEAAKRTAAATGRLVLVHFWAPWCKPCLNLDRNVLNKDSVGKAVEAQFVPVKLNADLYPASARRYGVTSLPTDVILTPDGKMVGKANSPPTAQAYLGQLAQIASQHRPMAGTLIAQGASQTHGAGSAQPGATYAGLASGTAPQAGNRYGAPAQTTPSPAAAPSRYDRYAQGNTPATTPQLPTRYPSMAAAGGSSPNGAPPTSVGMPVGYTPPSSAPAVPYGSQSNYSNSPTANVSPVGDRYASLPGAGINRYAAQPAPNASVGRPLQGAQQLQSAQQPALANSPYAGLAAQPATTAVAPFQPQSQNPPQSNFGQRPPSNFAQQPPAQVNTPAVQLPPGNPPLGLEGYCPVTLKSGQRWVLGDTRWGIVHRGRTYLFTGESQLKQFLTKPDFYSPVLSGYDPVLALENGQTVDGQRRHGVFFGDHIYLFSSEETLGRFRLNPEQYASRVKQVLQARGGQPAIR